MGQTLHRGEPQLGGEVGRGRSGVVYFHRDAAGRNVVEKVFGGDTASRLVLYAVTGAPNPYIWNADAIACAVARRRVLGHLVRHWFGDRLRLPRTDGSSWNADHRAFALHSEFIAGGHAPLRLAAPAPHVVAESDGSAAPPHDAIVDLRRRVMRPLQRRLREAGFDGLMWQAGLGNPVAANNFMLAGKTPADTGDAAPDSAAAADASDPPPAFRWVWIDLESGVPALFPADPRPLFTFYLPRAWHHRRPMFDDVDVPALRRYLDAERAALHASLGPDALAEIDAAVDQLDAHQSSWKTLSRVGRSIEASHKRGRITDEQAAWYRPRPVRWNLRLAARGAVSAGRATGERLRRCGRYLASVRWGMLGRSTLLFCTSQRFRTRLSHRLVSRRIGLYELRHQLDRRDARELRRELRGDESAEYITDFGVHLMIKPFMKTLQWTAVPALVGSGVISFYAGAALLAVGGSVGRTAYTLGRTVQASLRRQPLPLVALGVGVLPVVGNLAYPAQLAWAAEHRHRLARFVIDDTFATIGRRLPIWGGPDTLTEHFFNRLPLRLARWLPQRRATDPAPDAPAEETHRRDRGDRRDQTEMIITETQSHRQEDPFKRRDAEAQRSNN